MPVLGFGFLSNTAGRILRGLFPVLAVEYAHLSAAESGTIYMVSTAVVLIAGPLFGWLTDRISPRIAMLVRGAMNVLSSLLYWELPTFSGFVSGKVAEDAGKSAFRPAWGVIISDATAGNPAARGKAIGYMSASEDAGAVVGPVVGGLLWNTWGIGALFAARIIAAIAAETYAFVAIGKHITPRQ